MRLSTVILLTQLHLLSGVCASYYVSSSSGNDANSGTTTNTPWATLTNVYQFIQSPGFAAGDFLLLKAGDSFDGPIRINQSGTVGSPITIDRYGSGQNPIIYGDHPSATWSAVPGHAGIYSTYIGPNTIGINHVYELNGHSYTNAGLQGATAFDTWIGTFTTNKWGQSVASNIVYVATPDGNAPPQLRIMEQAVIGANAKSYQTYQNLELCNAYIGIDPYSCSHIVAQNNYIHDVTGNAIYFASCTSSTAASNNVRNTGSDFIYLQFGGNHWVHDNVCSNSGVTVLNIPAAGDRCGIGLQQGTNNLVERNSLFYVNVACFDYYYEVNTELRYNYGFHFTNNAVATDGTGLSVHHNVFDADGVGRGILGAQDYSAVFSPISNNIPQLIYNNVVYNFTYYGFYTDPGIAAGVVFRNNILVSTNSGMVMFQDGVDSDYNLFFMPSGTPNFKWNGTTYTSIGAYQSASGMDAHSIYADPVFAGVLPGLANGFRLASSSPCLNAGQWVTNSADYLGHPIVGAPDIGAFEFGAFANTVTLTVGTLKTAP